VDNSEILLYQTDDGLTRTDIRLKGDTIWQSQNQMTELFQTSMQNISLHFKNVFAEGELTQDSVVKEYLTTAADGKKYSTQFCILDAVLSVGYG
jgi:hypothetical protein